MEVTITPTERDERRLSEVHLGAAVSSLREHGYVILNDAVAHAHLERLTGKMSQDLERILDREEVPHNFVWGNVQQDVFDHSKHALQLVFPLPGLCLLKGKSTASD